MPKHPAINTPRNAPQDGRAQGRRVALPPPPCPWSSWKVGKVEKVNIKRNPEGKKRVASDTLAAEAFEVAKGSIADSDRVWQERFNRTIPKRHHARRGDPAPSGRATACPRWRCLSAAFPGVAATAPEASGTVLPAPCPGRLAGPPAPFPYCPHQMPHMAHNSPRCTRRFLSS